MSWRGPEKVCITWNKDQINVDCGQNPSVCRCWPVQEVRRWCWAWWGNWETRWNGHPSAAASGPAADINKVQPSVAYQCTLLEVNSTNKFYPSNKRNVKEALTWWTSELLSEWTLSLGELHPDTEVLLLLEEESGWQKRDNKIQCVNNASKSSKVSGMI